MKAHTRVVSFLLLSVLLIGSAISVAQSPTLGIPAFGSVDQTGFDAINRQNLNTYFSIPIVSYSGRGVGVDLILSYNSILWYKNGSVWSPLADVSGLPKTGWNQARTPLGTPTYRSRQFRCLDIYNHNAWEIVYDQWQYVDPKGTIHSFNISVTLSELPEDDPCKNLDPNRQPKGAFASDGSGYYLNLTDFNLGTGLPLVYNGLGMQVNYEGDVKDSNGNQINVNYDNWTDTRGKTVVKNTISPSQVQYQYLNNGGTYTIATLKLTGYYLKTQFLCTGVTDYTGTTLTYFPTELDLPYGNYYFSYEQTPNSGSQYTTGRITQVTLPTGATYQYQYPGSNGGINCADGTYNSLNRLITSDGATNTWTFSRTQDGTNWKTTVVYPIMAYDSVANQDVFTFTGNNEVSRQTYQGASSLQQTVTTTWSGSYPSLQTTTLPGSYGWHKDTAFSFDVYGNLLHRYEYDWTTVAGMGSLLRTTVVQYQTAQNYVNANLLGLTTSKKVFAGSSSGTLASSTEYFYDESGAVTSCPTGVPGHDYTNYGLYSTRPRGLLTTVKQYADLTNNGNGSPVITTYTYDCFGNVLTTKVAGVLQSTASYSATTKYSAPDSVTLGSSPTTTLASSYTYNQYTGLLVSQTDPNNGLAQLTYDSMLRPTGGTRPDNKSVTIAYDDPNRKVTTTTPLDTGRTLSDISFMDQLGRTFKVQSPTGTVQTIFDPLGRTYKISNPFANGGAGSYWTETRYDALGRTASVIAPDAVSSSLVYSTDADNAYIITSTDGAGKQKKNILDGLGRLTSVFEPDISQNNSLTVQTSYTYTALNSLSQVSQGVQNRMFTYDGLNRVKSVATPETSNVAFTYTYDSCSQAPSNVCSRTDARGVVTNYSYEALNRPYQVSYDVSHANGVRATNTVTYSYGTSTANFNNGRLIGVSDGTHTNGYTYDLMGNTLSVANTLGTQTYTTQYLYNDAGLQTRITYPSGMYLTQAYSTAGQLLSVVDNNGKQYASTFDYNPAGQVKNFAIGLSGGTVYPKLGYSDDRLQLTSLSYCTVATTPCPAGNKLFELTYGYTQAGGNNGRITSIADTVQAGRSASYGFDALNRLSSFSTTGSTLYPAQDYSWTFDRYGNRLTQTDNIAHTQQSLSPDAATNRLGGYTYDDNGNMLSDGALSLAWDAENHLVQYGANVSYEYDGNGLRVGKTFNGTTMYVFAGGNLLAEYAPNAAPDNPAVEYIYLGGTLLASKQSSGSKFFLRDHLSARATVDDQTLAVQEQGHKPYGERWYGDATKWRFTTYERDSESSLPSDYALARYNCNALGRFLSPDPVHGSIRVPQSWNRFSYALNDPVNMTDPSGMTAGWCMEVDYSEEGDPAPYFYPCELGGGAPSQGGEGSGPLDPGSNCARKFSKALKYPGGPAEFAKQFNRLYSNLKFVDARPVLNSPLSIFTGRKADSNITVGSLFAGTSAEAAVVLGRRNMPIFLGPDYYSDQSAAHQNAVKVHEGFHAITSWRDEDVFSQFPSMGMPNADYKLTRFLDHPNTDEFSTWIQKDCPPEEKQ